MSTQGNPAVRARMEIPWFKAGAGKPSIWSAADMNVLVAALRALINPSIVRGEVDQVLLADGNVQFVISKSAGGGGAVSGPYKLQSMKGDYLIAADSAGALVNIAKESRHRLSITNEGQRDYVAGPAESFAQLRLVYAHQDFVDPDFPPEFIEIQAIAPDWLLDEAIYAVTADTGVNDDNNLPVTLLIHGRTTLWSRMWGT